MVKAGVGLALIPSSLYKYSSSENVDYYSLLQNLPLREMAVIYQKDRYLSKALLTLKKIIVSV